MSELLLRARELSVSIDNEAGEVRALERLSFDIHSGETFALLGESGCGKSMTAMSIARLLPPGGRIAHGGVELAGRQLCELTEAEMRRVRGAEIAMIFQEPGTSLNPVMRVGQQIGEVLALHRGLRGAAARAEAVTLMREVGIPDPVRRLDEYPFQFSGGMKQRVMIAMALAGKPRLLIADEPTTALDVTIQAQVLEMMAALQREQGMAMLLITHDLGVVARMAHRIGVMYAGQLIETGGRDAFFTAPRHPYSQKLFEALPDAGRASGRLASIPGSVPPLSTRFGGCRFAPRCERAWERCRAEEPAWFDTGDGQRVRCHLFDPAESPPQPPPGAAEETTRVGAPLADTTLLSVRELEVHFPITRGLFKHVVGHVRAVDGVSLEVRAGRTLAVVGESGCGKTTLAKAVLRLVEPTAGLAFLGDAPITGARGTALRALRAQMQMVFQDPFSSLNPRMRVIEIIEEGMDALGVSGSPAQRRARVLELMQAVGLRPESAERYPHEFSGGQRQRIAIARALAVAPALIVCDEPTSALDVSVQAQILNLLRDLQARHGIAYLFITHNIGVVEYLAHDVAVMYLGRIVEHGSVAEVLGSPRHPYTRALLAAVPRASLDVPALRPAEATGTDELPSPAAPPSGCHFHPRCAQALEICRAHYPETRPVTPTHLVRCHLLD